MWFSSTYPEQTKQVLKLKNLENYLVQKIVNTHMNNKKYTLHK